MTTVIVVVVFLILFAVLMVTVGLGSRLLEMRSKKQMETILRPSTSVLEERETSILVEPTERDTLSELLEGSKLQAGVQTLLQQAGLQWAPSHLLVAMAVGTVVGGFLGYLLQPLGFLLASVLLFAFVLGGAPFFYVRRKRSTRLKELEEQLPEALDFLARSMRAGHAFSISLEMMSEEMPDPVGMEFRTLFNEQNLGAPIELALRNLTDRVPLLDVRFFASAVMMQRQTGGNLSEILARLAYVIRERFRLKGQVRAVSAHGRMTAGILTAMPICTMFALLMVAPGYLQGMADDVDGRKLIVGCIVAQVIGNICIRKIIRIKV
jgi:tight adherence protein B